MKTEYQSGGGKFDYPGGTVDPGETAHIRFPVSETYLGSSVNVPVSIINGEQSGPSMFITAAIHGDELNGIEVVRSVAREWNHEDINGTLVCIPVLNPLGFMAQQRYLPVHKRDLNRSFPGRKQSTGSKRIAHKLWMTFISKCDFGVDLHTSTRGRTNMFHVRADMNNKKTERLARALGSNVLIDTEGSEGMLRYEATTHGIPTVAIEMGEAHRFERNHIDTALEGLRSVFAEYGIHPEDTVNWPGWTTTVSGWGEKTWLRADSGGLVEMHHSAGDMVTEGSQIYTITSPFNDEKETEHAPYTGLVVGSLQNPVVYPGNPICHFAKLDETSIRIIESSSNGVSNRAAYE